MYRLLPSLLIMLCYGAVAWAEDTVPPPGYQQQTRAFEQVPPNAAGDEALAGGINPWHYWGARFDAQAHRLEPQPWRTSDDLVEGWDWSLPPSVKPAANARLRLGMFGWRKGIASFNPPPGLKVVDELWVRWRELEEVEGHYDFSQLETEIAQRLAQGCDGVIIRLLGAVWTNATPTEWKQWETDSPWRFRRWAAPRWLVETYGVDRLTLGEGQDEVVHVDIFHPQYHRKYLELIAAFQRSGILQRPEVQGLIVCGMCKANGEEGFGTYELTKAPRAVAQQRYAERLQAWQDAFGAPNKVIAMLPDGKAMVGARDGYVEMYLYLTNDPELRGQFVDDAGYLCVNEDAFYIRHGDQLIFGDENEEYHPGRYADQPGRPGRFGPLESFNYRYFTSMLRTLQMRRNYLYVEETAVNPQLLWYASHQLGRSAQDAPDAWCFLRESYLSGYGDETAKGPLKNFERWLHQRDRESHPTTPAVKIPHALKQWWLADAEHRYDYVARRGERIGFAVGDDFLQGRARVAVKVTYYDGYAGHWMLRYHRTGQTIASTPIATTGADAFRTATLFIDAEFNATHLDFDFEIVSPQQVPISFVRIVKP